MSRLTLSSTVARERMAALGAREAGHGGEPYDETERSLRAYACVAWSCLVEPGDGGAGRLIAALGPVRALEVALAGQIGASMAESIGLTARETRDALARWSPRMDQGSVDAAFTSAARVGATLITPDDDGWPAGLRDLDMHAPVCLWARGTPAALDQIAPSLAVVGARAATGYGEHVAMELSAELAGRGVRIVSGAAYGIDGAAHRAALAAEGSTLALLAGGVDRAYPAGHTDLLARIAASGAVVSEVPCGSAPTKWRFLQRNRLIAAISDATVVVEAGWRSGSLNTAGHAADLGRPLGAVPGPITSAASAGCHRLLREFDARCITSADDAAELLGIGLPTQALIEVDEGGRYRSAESSRVADALSTRARRRVDDVARRSGMSVGDVSNALGMMRLAGEADDDGTGWRLLPSTARS